MYRFFVALMAMPIVFCLAATPAGWLTTNQHDNTVVTFSSEEHKVAYDIRSEYDETCLDIEFPVEEVEPVCWEYDETISPERNIYDYLTEELSFSKAAACGILGNIAYETGWTFNPEIGSEYGCYGLIQWLGGRLGQLKSWCNETGRDYSTMQGQMDFVLWELENTDTYGTLDYLMSCDDSIDGAYNAGWYFCYWYERPNDKNAQSNYRGCEAIKYYGMFAEN